MHSSTLLFVAFLFAAAAVIGSYGADKTNCYGSIDDLSPTGKNPNGKSGRRKCYGTNTKTGVEGSKADVDYRISNLRNNKTCVQDVGKELCIEPALIAGIISRETQGGALLNATGYGRYDSNGYGLMQCDINTSGADCTKYGPWSCDHIKMMTEFLIGKIKSVQRRRSSWTKTQQLQGGVAAYNHFPPSSFSSVDDYTTCDDYSNDVIARAQYLKSEYDF